jgi:hypothetical protein
MRMGVEMSRPDLSNPKDYAYWERNQLVAALSKIYPAWLERHPASDVMWENDWRWIVFIEIPTRELENKYVQGGFMMDHTRQLSWHIHDTERDNFYHLEEREGNSWDGHSNDEKYRRLSRIKGPNFFVKLWRGLL